MSCSMIHQPSFGGLDWMSRWEPASGRCWGQAATIATVGARLTQGIVVLVGMVNYDYYTRRNGVIDAEMGCLLCVVVGEKLDGSK